VPCINGNTFLKRPLAAFVIALAMAGHDHGELKVSFYFWGLRPDPTSHTPAEADEIRCKVLAPENVGNNKMLCGCKCMYFVCLADGINFTRQSKRRIRVKARKCHIYFLR